MPVIRIETLIHAPIDRCFDLTRSIDLHTRSTGRTAERAIAGRTTGLMHAGELVTWRARHFGLTQNLTTCMAQLVRPTHMRTTLVRGTFARMIHDHDFRVTGEGTLMQDTFDFAAPLGLLGWIAEQLVVTRYMKRFLKERALVIKAVAESEEWKTYLSSQ
jgi:ligand-binding SRPBCC domain-containing protein